MRKRLRDWLGLNKEQGMWEFKQAKLTETTGELANPARGWYTIYTFMAEEEPDLKELEWCADIKDTLALVIINIGAYREKALDWAAKEHIRSILAFFKKHSFDIILRFTYDHEGKALEREPFFFKQVKEHLGQLCLLTEEFADEVFVLQGMLIGNWGEMHTSRFLSPEKLREMWQILCDKLKGKVFLAVRRPSMWRILNAEACGRVSLMEYDSTGLFDDAIFGSDSHLGTFGEESKVNTGWDGLWNRAEELEFEDRLCLTVPNGGEAVCGQNYEKSFNPQTTIDLLRRMHITYLNQAYDENIIKLWKEWKWEEAGVWQNSTLFDYIGQHLGYRFVVKDAFVKVDSVNKDMLKLLVNIENTGFANCYQEAEVLLEYRDNEASYHLVNVECDIRKWNSGTVNTIVAAAIPAKACEVYLSIKRKADGRIIYPANETDGEGRVLLGCVTEV